MFKLRLQQCRLHGVSVAFNIIHLFLYFFFSFANLYYIQLWTYHGFALFICSFCYARFESRIIDWIWWRNVWWPFLLCIMKGRFFFGMMAFNTSVMFFKLLSVMDSWATLFCGWRTILECSRLWERRKFYLTINEWSIVDECVGSWYLISKFFTF